MHQGDVIARNALARQFTRSSRAVSQAIWTPGDGYTAEARDTGFPNLIEDAIVPPGTYMPDAMLPPNHNDLCWIGTAAAFHTR